MTAPTITGMAVDRAGEDTALEATADVQLPTDAVELAWADVPDEPAPERHSWTTASWTAAVLTLSAAVLAGVVGTVGWAHRPARTAAPAPTTVTVQAPAPSVPAVTPAPSTTTVVVQNPAPKPTFDDGDGVPTAAPKPAMTPDDRFISWLAADNMIPDDRAITIHNGRAICDDFRRNIPRPAIQASTKAATGLPDFAVTDFVSLAVNAYCPQYVGELVK